MSYSFTEKSQIYTSYSRRIQRFPSYFLEPTPIKTGATSYFQGNPNLKPKISNSFELGFSTSFKKSTTLAIEVFYKLNTDEYQFISSAFEDSISTLQQPYNIGTSQNIGTEINSGFKILKWWKIDLMWTGYYETLNGEFKGQDFNKNSFVWRARINNNFTITKNTKLQFSGNYRSKRVTVLGNYVGSLSFDLGLKQSFLKKALNATFNMRNVFYTAQSESTTSYKNYFLHSKEKLSWPFLTLGLSYKINNYRQSRRQTEGGRGSF